MKITLHTIKVRELVNGYQDNDEAGVVGFDGKLDIRPPYQREFCYNDNQQQAVMDTVTNGFPLNTMYWAKTDDGRYELMDGQLGQVLMDNDLNLLIDEKGKAREAELFSTGTYECMMLCMRMALIEALFTDEQPFLVLDDPFANLDDRHTQRALDMVKRIAQKHQIIYLVCNSSRSC